MEEKYLAMLLDIVKRNSDVKQLIIQYNLDYKTIGDLTTLALKNEYLNYNDGTIQITEKGIAKIESTESKFKKINKDEWILPEIKSRIKKIDKNDIFLPKQTELTF